MTSVFDDGGRGPVAAPVALSPEAAQGNGDGSSGPGFDFSFMVGLSASIGSLVDEMRAERDRRRALVPPSNEQLFGAGNASATGFLAIDLGSVPLGHAWQIRRVIVGGVDVGTAAAGQAYLFKRGSPPKATDLDVTSCVWVAAPTLPNGDTFGTHQLWLPALSHLWCVFTGATSGQQYAVSCDVEDWTADAFGSTFAE